MASADLAAALTECDREPIHALGRVQAFGALIAVNDAFAITYCSANVAKVLGLATTVQPDLPLSQVLEGPAVNALQQLVTSLDAGDRVMRSFALPLNPELQVDVAAYRSGQNLVFEFEPHRPAERQDYIAQLRPIFDRLAKAQSQDELLQSAARQLQALIGFDRVMVYRFAADGHGEVAAECHAPGMESLAGLRYPASDIPQQARALYLRNLLRIISDTHEAGSPIAASAAQSEPLDLSLSVIRAVSPVHLEYLHNMGVAASLSISVVKQGKLWGLLACHHRTPKVLPLELRSAAELFGEMFALNLDQQDTQAEKRELLRARVVHDQIMISLAQGATINNSFAEMIGLVGTIIPHDGAIGWVDGRLQSSGAVPSAAQFSAITGFLDTATRGGIYHTDELAAACPAAADFADIAAGVLVLPVSRDPKDYIVLFRRELARSILWAGERAKVQSADKRLVPRKSFAAWQELVSGRSQPWSPGEVQTADTLRVTLLEVVLRMTDATLQERRTAEQQQEVLIAELNHRVRNILNLVRSLITQSQSQASSISEFTEVVGLRVQALARAHDLITKGNWSPTSAQALVRTEAEAYLGESAARVEITGPDPQLMPDAITTFALVIHELMTNSAKYGAMSAPLGRLVIGFSQGADGTFGLDWNEQGGPQITQQPTRRGFGSTLIERSIPYELGGTAQLSFAPGGLRAQFTVPARHVTGFTSGLAVAAAGDSLVLAGHAKPLQAAVLLVEDNMLIALDAEDMLLALGARNVLTCASVLEAEQAMAGAEIEFAVLDVNLGGETTEPVAQQLIARGVPFAFATGYGETASLVAQFPGVDIVQKPYQLASLRAAIVRSLPHSDRTARD